MSAPEGSGVSARRKDRYQILNRVIKPLREIAREVDEVGAPDWVEAVEDQVLLALNIVKGIADGTEVDLGLVANTEQQMEWRDLDADLSRFDEVEKILSAFPSDLALFRSGEITHIELLDRFVSLLVQIIKDSWGRTSAESLTVPSDISYWFDD